MMKGSSHTSNKSYEVHLAPTSLLIDAIVSLVTDIIKKLLQQGVFPSAHKQANIKALLENKINLDLDLKNYQPVLNLTYLSMLLEKAVLQQIMGHLTFHNLIPINLHTGRTTVQKTLS